VTHSSRAVKRVCVLTVSRAREAVAGYLGTELMICECVLVRMFVCMHLLHWQKTPSSAALTAPAWPLGIPSCRGMASNNTTTCPGGMHQDGNVGGAGGCCGTGFGWP